MVFSKLSTPEKEAFFGLLDEYFQSRPELFGPGGGHQGQGDSTNALGLAAARAIVGGAATVAASSSNNNNNAVPANKFSANNPYRSVLTAGIGGGRKNEGESAGPGNNHNADESAAHAAQALGRVAAVSLAFSGGGGGQSQPAISSASASPSARVLPVGAGAVPVSVAGRVGGALGTPGGEVDKLVSGKASILSSFRKKGPSAGSMAALPSAFAPPKSAFGPPPARRTTSATATASTSTGTGTGTGTGTRSVPPAPSRQPQEEEAAEPETEYAEGEWAEVLYDYNSEDPGDLSIEAGSRVFVTAKSSEDWWTGQVEGQGKEGLFPASYVKLL